MILFLNDVDNTPENFAKAADYVQQDELRTASRGAEDNNSPPLETDTASYKSHSFQCVNEYFTQPVHITVKSIAKLENCHFIPGSSLVVTEPILSMQGMSFSDLAITAPSVFLDGVSLDGTVEFTVDSLYGFQGKNESKGTLAFHFQNEAITVNNEFLSLFSTLKGTLEIYGASFDASAKNLKELDRLKVVAEKGNFKLIAEEAPLILSQGLDVSVPGWCLIADGNVVTKDLNLTCGEAIILQATTLKVNGKSSFHTKHLRTLPSVYKKIIEDNPTQVRKGIEVAFGYVPGSIRTREKSHLDTVFAAAPEITETELPESSNSELQ